MQEATDSVLPTAEIEREEDKRIALLSILKYTAQTPNKEPREEKKEQCSQPYSNKTKQGTFLVSFLCSLYTPQKATKKKPKVWPMGCYQ
jgi:hypothetical protein